MAMNLPLEEDLRAGFGQKCGMPLTVENVTQKVVRKAHTLEMEWKRKIECVPEQTQRGMFRENQEAAH